MIRAIARPCKLVLVAALLALVAPAAIQSAHAADNSKPTPKPIGTFRDWSAYTMDKAGKKVCFIVSEPKSKGLSNPKAHRDDPFFLITRWGAGQTPQPSMIVGYPQKADSKASVKIGSNSFEMFVDGDGAWMESEDGDKKLTAAMKKGSTMTIRSQSSRGTKSTDRYSLSGVTAALKKIEQECP
jgi:hypothetical protein